MSNVSWSGRQKQAFANHAGLGVEATLIDDPLRRKRSVSRRQLRCHQRLSRLFPRTCDERARVWSGSTVVLSSNRHAGKSNCVASQNDTYDARFVGDEIEDRAHRGLKSDTQRAHLVSGWAWHPQIESPILARQRTKHSVAVVGGRDDNDTGCWCDSVWQQDLAAQPLRRELARIQRECADSCKAQAVCHDYGM